ncbi:hypothetical protein BFP72_00160 [Reichenbachiella sp. 5M10]|uniref:DUF1573 domain-containing protein n=1 Tax=Reichenbachiella sp. 5M10 TaxID=1889772 RepID=UPI000C5035F5|nr:DUF1573 domain-containing protein [Reichenbachiella sp. 5M10]PIB33956.1 hypothetical protein BFP72_00160 [Reichenbachiella sp. 5M10]
MRNITLLSAVVAVFALTMTGCSNADLESRVSRLEGRVAELEGKGIASSRATATAQPAATNEPEVKPDGPLPVFAFAEESHDFGTINEGDKVIHVFEFENTGDAPLIISDAKGSCGCTVPEWPKEPIGIGEKGEIKVEFNSRKKPGIQNKTVTITANTFPKQTRIKIKANVTPAATDS